MSPSRTATGREFQRHGVGSSYWEKSWDLIGMQEWSPNMSLQAADMFSYMLDSMHCANLMKSVVQWAEICKCYWSKLRRVPCDRINCCRALPVDNLAASFNMKCVLMCLLGDIGVYISVSDCKSCYMCVMSCGIGSGSLGAMIQAFQLYCPLPKP